MCKCVCLHFMCIINTGETPMRVELIWKRGNRVLLPAFIPYSFAFLSGTKIINAQQDKATRVSSEALRAAPRHGAPLLPGVEALWAPPTKTVMRRGQCQHKSDLRLTPRGQSEPKIRFGEASPEVSLH